MLVGEMVLSIFSDMEREVVMDDIIYVCIVFCGVNFIFKNLIREWDNFY